MASLASSNVPSEHAISMYHEEVARNGSPPWRDDDKDGHYMFAVGENLTTRCKYAVTVSLMFDYALDWLSLWIFF